MPNQLLYISGALHTIVEGTVVPSGTYTATQSYDVANVHGKSLTLVLDVTAVTATGSLTVTIQGKDEASGKYYPLLTGAAVTTVSTNVYRISPELPAVANQTAQTILPKVINVTVTAANVVAMTYSVGLSFGM